jgi:hypothetical protein
MKLAGTMFPSVRVEVLLVDCPLESSESAANSSPPHVTTSMHTTWKKILQEFFALPQKYFRWSRGQSGAASIT